MSRELTLTYLKSTKATHVYNNPDYNVTFYVPKSLLEGKIPPQIVLTITSKED